MSEPQGEESTPRPPRFSWVLAMLFVAATLAIAVWIAYLITKDNIPSVHR